MGRESDPLSTSCPFTRIEEVPAVATGATLICPTVSGTVTLNAVRVELKAGSREPAVVVSRASEGSLSTGSDAKPVTWESHAAAAPMAAKAASRRIRGYLMPVWTRKIRDHS